MKFLELFIVKKTSFFCDMYGGRAGLVYEVALVCLLLFEAWLCPDVLSGCPRVPKSSVHTLWRFTLRLEMFLELILGGPQLSMNLLAGEVKPLQDKTRVLEVLERNCGLAADEVLKISGK